MDNEEVINTEIDTVPVKRRLGFVSGVSIIVGSIIGSGIFVSPKGVLMNTGSAGMCLLVWLLCGIFSILSALIYAELGLLVPRSGGDFNYLLAVFGSFPAFMFAWSQFLVIPGATTILGLTVAEYITKVVFGGCGPNGIVLKLIAVFVVFSAGIINCVSVRLADRTQVIFTLLKLSGLLVIIIGGLIRISQGQFGFLASGFAESETSPAKIALAFNSGLFSFGGWQFLNNVVEELDKPRRNLPLCVISSMVLVTVTYILVNVSYLAVMSNTEFLSSWAVAVTWAEREIGSAVVIMPIIVSCSVFGTLTVTLLVSGRVPFAAARAGIFPELLSYLNVSNGIPIPATLVITVLSFILMIPADIGMIINMLSFVSWLINGLNSIAFIVLRYRMKNVDTPIKLPLMVPIIVLIVCVYLTVAPFLGPVRTEFLYALGYLLLGALIYVPFVLLKLSIPGIGMISKICQLLMNVAPTTKLCTEDSIQRKHI